MKNFPDLYFRIFSAAVLLAVLTGCGTSAHYIEPGSAEALVTISEIDQADWTKAAANAANSLVASGALKRKDGKKPVVMISRIRNYTLQHIESKILVNKIRQAILASGQAAVSSAVGYGSNIDIAVRRIRAKELDDLFNAKTVPPRGTVIAPNLSLSGSIIQQTTYKGRDEESYFMFHLTLTDLDTGLAVWENITEVAKQGRHSVFK